MKTRDRSVDSVLLHHLMASFITALLICGFGPFLYRINFAANELVQATGSDKAFAGGTFEASGVTHVAGTDGILFVDDGRPDEVLWMQLDKSGSQTGDIKLVKLGVSIEDPEGITTDGSNFYIVGSQSKGKGSDLHGIIRFKFDPKTQTVASTETVSGLKKFLVENVAELRDFAGKKGKGQAINIEGLAWDPQNERLLLGLRSPVVEGKALLVALKLRDPSGPFSYENFAKPEMKTVRLELGGMGIRSIEYDDRAKTFWIISGAAENSANKDPKLWEWGGNESQSVLREIALLSKTLKPEGVTRASIGGSDFTFIVFDTSRYLRMD